MWETGDILKVSKLSTENHLHLHDYVNRFEVWVPQKLKGWGALSCPHSTRWFSMESNETILLASKLLGAYELLNFENNVEQERWWANEGTTTSSSSTGWSSSRAGDVAYVVITEQVL